MRTAITTLLLLAALSPAPAAKAANGKPAPSKDSLFIEASLDNRTPFVGQEVTLTYSLFFREIAPRIADSGKADHPGLWVQEVTPEGYITSTRTTVAGRPYRKAVIKQLKLVPMQAGKLSVANYRLRCYLPASTGVGFGSQKDIERIIAAPTASIETKPLPKPAPEGFGGAVGDFTLTLATDSYQVHVGEPLVLSVKISGKGNLKAFPQVALNFPAGFKPIETSVPTVTQEDSGEPEESVSSKISFNPEQEGSFRFTPVRLTAFNPWKGRYETISSGAIFVRVLPPAATPAGNGSDSLRQVEETADSLVPNAIMIGLSTAVLLLIFILASIARTLSRKPEAPSTAGIPQPLLPDPAGNALLETLRSRLFDALRKLGVRNPAGMTAPELRNKLAELKVAPQKIEALLSLMMTIDQAAFTPGKTSQSTIAALQRQLDALLATLTKENGA